MLQSATGLLTIVDANTPTPSVFWRGKKVSVLTIVVAGNTVLFRVTKWLLSPELLADFVSNGLKVKEVQS